MKFIVNILILLCINFILSSCKSSCEKDTIKVGISKEIEVVEDSSLFVGANAFLLESNDEGMIASIDYVIEHDDFFYILDKKRNQVLTYDNNGKFINSIGSIGNGPGEYTRLMDIAIDRDSRQLLLLDYPSNILYYDLDGRYIRTTKLNSETSFHSLVVDKKFIYLLNPTHYNNKPSNHSITVVNKNNQSESFHILKPLENAIPYCNPQGRTLNNGKNINFTRLFDDNIYILNGNKHTSRLIVDFGKYKLPEHVKNGKTDCRELLSYCWENKYVCTISNIVENDKSMIFSTNLPGIFTLDHDLNAVKHYKKIMNTDYNIAMPNFMSVDSEHGRVFFIYPAASLSSLKNVVKKNPKLQEKYSGKFLDLLDNVSEDSNPMVFSYRLK